VIIVVVCRVAVVDVNICVGFVVVAVDVVVGVIVGIVVCVWY